MFACIIGADGAEQIIRGSAPSIICSSMGGQVMITSLMASDMIDLARRAREARIFVSLANRRVDVQVPAASSNEKAYGDNRFAELISITTGPTHS